MIAVCLAVGLWLGCGSDEDETVTELDLPAGPGEVRPRPEPPTTTKARPPLPDLNLAETDARAALLASFRASQQRKYRTRATLDVRAGPGAGTTRWTSEWQPPDRRTGVMTLPNGREAFMLAIGSRVWGRRSATAEWEEAPPGAGQAGDLEQRIAQAIESGALRAERLGEDTRDGRPVINYAITWTQPPAQGGGTMTGRVAVGTDGLAYAFEGDSDRPPTRVSLTYEYDDTIAIEAPPAPTSPPNRPSR